MGAIEGIVKFLEQYPFLQYGRREDAIWVLPSSKNGFEVALVVSPGHYTVSYAIWHTEFSDEQMAVNAFINGLSDRVRLEVSSRGNVDYRWIALIRGPEGWMSGGAVGIFRYRFWKKKEIRYLQNDYFISTDLEGQTPAIS